MGRPGDGMSTEQLIPPLYLSPARPSRVLRTLDAGEIEPVTLRRGEFSFSLKNFSTAPVLTGYSKKLSPIRHVRDYLWTVEDSSPGRVHA